LDLTVDIETLSIDLAAQGITAQDLRQALADATALKDRGLVQENSSMEDVLKVMNKGENNG